MRVSFSTGTFYHRDLRYSLDLARETGYDGVELVLGLGYLTRGLAPIQRAIATAGVPVLSVHPPMLPLPGWPRRHTQAIPRLATVTRTLGAEVFVVHVPYVTSEHEPHAEHYSAGLRLGKSAGGATQIGLESAQFNKRKERYYLDDLEQLTRFAVERGCGVTFDTCHTGANGQDLLACYEIVRPALCNVHLSDVVWRDGVPNTHILPGEGTLPLVPFLARLARDGYAGPVTLEIHPRMAGLFGRSHAAARLRQALDFVRGAIASGSEQRAPEATV